jgi:hypothetical protein
VRPWNRKFSVEPADDSPFRVREFIDGKDVLTRALDNEDQLIRDLAIWALHASADDA